MKERKEVIGVGITLDSYLDWVVNKEIKNKKLEKLDMSKYYHQHCNFLNVNNAKSYAQKYFNNTVINDCLIVETYVKNKQLFNNEYVYNDRLNKFVFRKKYRTADWRQQ